ncbi:MAG: WbqC family protein [Prevotellaceae bacterium]|jgi:effector-binding domain-containing protein|nr:WbqC family protein [Prevotellaceae bacterium]
MKAVIHQPYFLPWMGYFSKLIHADKFIVLDNVYYSAHNYIDRTQIINPQGNLMWLKLPIGSPIKRRINEIDFIDYTNININNEINKIIQTLHASYSKARFFKENINSIKTILIDSFLNYSLLSEINIYIIIKLMELLKMKIPQIIYSSFFHTIENATDRIIMLCEQTHCNHIIVGSIEGIYVHDEHRIKKSGISFLLQDYFNNHPTYYQTRRQQLGFVKGLSIIDCIFNEGIEKTKRLLFDSKLLNTTST